jgi:hypothetical protein
MTAEFNVWLLLVGLVVGGGLTWLVIGELRRSDADVGRGERKLEAGWISDQLAGTDEAVTEPQAEAVLRLHRRYLAISLPPEPVADSSDEQIGSEAGAESGEQNGSEAAAESGRSAVAESSTDTMVETSAADPAGPRPRSRRRG